MAAAVVAVPLPLERRCGCFVDGAIAVAVVMVSDDGCDDGSINRLMNCCACGGVARESLAN